MSGDAEKNGHPIRDDRVLLTVKSFETNGT